MMQFGYLITVLAVTARLSDFLQQKCVAPLAQVIPHSRPPVVHVIGREENNKFHNGKPELMSSIVPPCCGCTLGQLHSVDIMGEKYPQMGYNPSALLFCAVCVRLCKLTLDFRCV